METAQPGLPLVIAVLAIMIFRLTAALVVLLEDGINPVTAQNFGVQEPSIKGDLG
jgi:hypothetical protein